MKLRLVALSFSCLVIGSLAGCSSAPEVKTLAYAQLRNEQTFETDFPAAWKAIESALRLTRVVSKTPAEVSPLELKKLSQRNLETDWIFSKSKSKYIEYQVNGFPRKTYLQNRFKYQVSAEQVLGGVKVKTTVTEEVERLNAQGGSEGFSTTGEPDPSLANDLIEKISRELNSAPAI